MAELLIRVEDKINTDDFYKNCQCSKRGDVIVVAEDGVAWGEDELTLPFWRILRVPLLRFDEAEGLLMPEVDQDPMNPSRTLQRRASRLDLDDAALSADLETYLSDAARKVPAYTLDKSEHVDLIRSIVVTKDPIADPRVITP